jgi:hypothetical protein
MLGFPLNYPETQPRGRGYLPVCATVLGGSKGAAPGSGCLPVCAAMTGASQGRVPSPGERTGALDFGTL